MCRSPMKISVIIVAISLGYVSANCTSSFNRLNETTQACPGSYLVFECSIIVERVNGSTVFQGDLLDCEIILLHNRFNVTSADTGITCNEGMVVGYSLPVYNLSNCYVSQLRITVTPNMTGKSIICAYDDGITAKDIGSFSIEAAQCYTMTVTTITPSTAPSDNVSAAVQTIVTTVYKNSTGTLAPAHYEAIKSLSTGEVTAIVLCCSALIVGIMITVIILLTIRFKKQFQAIQTPSSVHSIIQDNPISTSPNANSRQQTQATFHCAQDDEDDSEYSHLQHPGPQHTLRMKPRANFQPIYM